MPERYAFIDHSVFRCVECYEDFIWDSICGIVHPHNIKGSHVCPLGKYSRMSFYRDNDNRWVCPECGGAVKSIEQDSIVLPNDCVNIWSEELA